MSEDDDDYDGSFINDDSDEMLEEMEDSDSLLDDDGEEYEFDN